MFGISQLTRKESCHCEGASLKQSDPGVIPSEARNLMGLLRLGSQLRLRGVYTEQRECIRNDDYMSPYLKRLLYITFSKHKFIFDGSASLAPSYVSAKYLFL